MSSEIVEHRPVPAQGGTAESLSQWILSDRRAQALVAALGANLMMNVVNVVPVLGPVVELFADVGFEAVALLIATSILRRDGKPLKGLLILAGLGAAKIALDGLNLLPAVGSIVETMSEAGLDLTQLWFLKELVRPSGRPALPPARD